MEPARVDSGLVSGEVLRGSTGLQAFSFGSAVLPEPANSGSGALMEAVTVVVGKSCHALLLT